MITTIATVILMMMILTIVTASASSAADAGVAADADVAAFPAGSSSTSASSGDCLSIGPSPPASIEFESVSQHILCDDEDARLLVFERSVTSQPRQFAALQRQQVEIRKNAPEVFFSGFGEELHVGVGEGSESHASP